MTASYEQINSFSLSSSLSFFSSSFEYSLMTLFNLMYMSSSSSYSYKLFNSSIFILDFTFFAILAEFTFVFNLDSRSLWLKLNDLTFKVAWGWAGWLFSTTCFLTSWSFPIDIFLFNVLIYWLSASMTVIILWFSAASLSYLVLFCLKGSPWLWILLMN